MLKELLEFIYDQARKDANPKPHIRHIGPRQRIRTLQGVEVAELLEPASARMSVRSLNDFVSIIKAHGGDRKTIYIDAEKIKCILDEDDRTETVTLLFGESEQQTAASDLEDGLQQDEFISKLRTSFAGCVQHETIIQLFRRLTFDDNRQTRGNVSHADSSLGETVERQARAEAGEIPEDVMVSYPLWTVPTDFPSYVTYRCSISVLAQSRLIYLIGQGSEFYAERNRVIAEMQDALHGLLDAAGVEGVTVVQGSCTLSELE